jgi:hypothetical protein
MAHRTLSATLAFAMILAALPTGDVAGDIPNHDNPNAPDSQAGQSAGAASAAGAASCAWRALSSRSPAGLIA